MARPIARRGAARSVSATTASTNRLADPGNLTIQIASSTSATPAGRNHSDVRNGTPTGRRSTPPVHASSPAHIANMAVRPSKVALVRVGDPERAGDDMRRVYDLSR